MGELEDFYFDINEICGYRKKGKAVILYRKKEKDISLYIHRENVCNSFVKQLEQYFKKRENVIFYEGDYLC